VDSTNGQLIRWGHDALTLVIGWSAEAPPAMIHLSSADVSGYDLAAAIETVSPAGHQPLAEVQIAGEGQTWSGTRSISTAVGTRLRYVGHAESSDGQWRHLRIDSADPVSGLRVEVHVRSVPGVSAVQAWTHVINAGDAPVVLHAVSSLASSAFLREAGSVDDVDLHWARSEWLAESRWTCSPVRDFYLPDIDTGLHGNRSRGGFVVTNSGSWSTSDVLPTAVIVHRPTARSWAWQVEHNGAWRWEIGEYGDGLYVAAGGPNDVDHQWQQVLDPGEGFESVPVGLVLSGDGIDGAAAALTRYRRLIVRDHPDRQALPVVFNDYMNTLMGDPTTEKLVPLIDAAGKVGAEYFCIDAGWHDDARGGHWAYEIGAWEPSTTRFDGGGLTAIIDRIRDAGMVPGLWLEPEVMGVASPAARELPDEAFFQRGGRRHIEDGRYHLDLRHPAAVAHLDGVIDRLVDEFGIGYFKFDYNVDAGVGTEVKAASPGAGLLGHNRAHLAWLDRLIDRHPGLVIENCGSGAMRMDYGILARTQLQSTSDQQNPLLYPPVAVAAPMSVVPEQSASWAYPQPDMSAEEIAFCMVTGMMGRLYQSGHLDRMDADQLRLVADGIAVHKRIRGELAQAVPAWPLGLPEWSDRWLALALQPADSSRSTYLAVWRRPGASRDVQLPLSHLADASVRYEVVYPTELPPWTMNWSSGALHIGSDADVAAARVIKLTPVR
jgi:alpha-galactosidase